MLIYLFFIFETRGSSFKEDEGTWKGNDDGKVVNNQPQRVMDERNGVGPQSGYISKITGDARETEMEDNMGQVNTMIGNLRNMAIDMGSELENQNRQIDRINRKVNKFYRKGKRRRKREYHFYTIFNPYFFLFFAFVSFNNFLFHYFYSYCHHIYFYSYSRKMTIRL